MSWENVTLGRCCEIVSGATPRRNVPEYWGGDIAWATPKDISGIEGPILFDTPEYISKAGYKSCSARILPKDSILFSSRAPIGLVAIAGREMCTNQGFKSLIPGPDVDSTYLYYCMKKYADRIAALGSGATFKEVSKEKVSNFPIPLPPLKEQKRIATILDKTDAIRRKRRQAIQLADEFLRSVFLDMFGDPVLNPMWYNSAPLGDLVEIVSGGTPSRTEKKFWNGTFPWVSPKDMKSITIFNSIEKISENVFSETSLKRIPKKSILIVIRGMILAHTIPIAITEEKVAINQDIKALKVRNSLLPEFLLWSLLVQHNFILSKVSTAAHGTKRLDTADLQQIKIPLPNIELQSKFIEITEKFSKVNAQASFSLKKAENLFHSLVQKAFRGEL
jgi:type I restriction enzyme S subunit